jgi:hypothetical protein
VRAIADEISIADELAPVKTSRAGKIK